METIKVAKRKYSEKRFQPGRGLGSYKDPSKHSQTKEAKGARIILERKRSDSESVNHKSIKTKHAQEILAPYSGLKILELFQGNGGMTSTYSYYGDVDGFDRKNGDGDSFIKFHTLISEKRKYNVIDLDPYGFPNRLFPDIFMLIDDGFLFVTTPNGKSVRNPWTKNLNTQYWGNPKPELNDFIVNIIGYGRGHKREVKFINNINLTDKMFRMVFRVKRMNATKCKPKVDLLY